MNAQQLQDALQARLPEYTFDVIYWTGPKGEGYFHINWSGDNRAGIFGMTLEFAEDTDFAVELTARRLEGRLMW